MLEAILPPGMVDSRPPLALNLARSIILIGPEQNDPACVRQRKALKPILHDVRRVHINVVEIYGNEAPRRNGQPMKWLKTKRLRKNLGAVSGFHFICVDDDGEVRVQGRVPVSQAVLAELVMGEERMALPAPGTPSGPSKTDRPAHTQAKPSSRHSDRQEPKKRTTITISDVKPAAEASDSDSPWSVGVLR